jgi:hypothetical protein
MLINNILTVLDFFHKPFKRILTQQQFRYLASGGFQAFLDAFLYFIGYNYILRRHPFYIGNYEIQAYTAQFWLQFPVIFFVGFFASKYVVFPGSHLKTSSQFFRFILVVGLCMFLGLYILKFFVEICHIYPTVAKLTTTMVVSIVSYVVQRLFAFKSHKLY